MSGRTAAQVGPGVVSAGPLGAVYEPGAVGSLPGFGMTPFGALGGYALPPTAVSVANGYVPGGGVGVGPGNWTGYGMDITGWGTGYGTGWGFGYANPYLGYGAGYSAYGQSPYSLAIMRSQQYALNASRFNLMNAQASLAANMAYLVQAKALDDYANRYRLAKLMQRRYLVSDTAAREARHQRRLMMTNRQLPTEDLIDSQGNVQWPASTPKDDELASAKKEADAAIQTAYRQYKNDGQASVRTAVDARNKLAAFGTAALNRLKDRDSPEADNFQRFLFNLDGVLSGMSNPATQPGRTSVTPETAPRSGGDVLKDTLKEEGQTSPRSAGDVAKPATRKD